MLSVNPLHLSAWDTVGDEVVETTSTPSSPVLASIPAVDFPAQPLEISPDGFATLTAGSPLGPALFPLSQTFLLHSNPGASHVIYLDFDGHITRDTEWNVFTEIPNIVTPSVSADGFFSPSEQAWVQRVWARVAEDFLPFDVNVTTDSIVEPLLDGNGVRAAIGGSFSDWYGESAGGVAFLNSFLWPNVGPNDNDTPVFVFTDNLGGGHEKFVADAISHEVGHALGLIHDGQIIPGEDDPLEYYGGHGPNSPAPTGWGPIMGAPFDKEFTHWSDGRYPNANNLEDDLDIIAGGGNGFGWWTGEVISTLSGYSRLDVDGNPLPNHGDTIGTATELGSGTTFFGEGLISRTIDPMTGALIKDIDFFSFDVGVEEVLVSVDPVSLGPNLDIRARLYDSSGVEIATSYVRADLIASFTINTRLQALSYLTPNGIINTEFLSALVPGTYYISIEGTGKPSSANDPGYPDYGSLGYYSIFGSRQKLFLDLGPLVGVDFNVPGGTVPSNWNSYSGGPASNVVMTDLIDETGDATDISLTVSTTGPSLDTYSSTVSDATVPVHPVALDELGGYISPGGEMLTFTWSHLDPGTVYEVYVFGNADVAGFNVVEIFGFGEGPAVSFEQELSFDDLIVNSQRGSNIRDLVEFGKVVQPTAEGTITITVHNVTGEISAVAGLAVRRAKLGALEGVKWHDANGNRLMDFNEEALGGWTIYLDLNNNGVLDETFTVETPSHDVPQAILDETRVKSEVLFQGPVGMTTLQDIEVTLNITHTFVADLRISLKSPSGESIQLVANKGGSGRNFTNTVFADDADRSIESVTRLDAPFTGRFRPMEPMSRFFGENPNGVWTLEIFDAGAGDVGELNSWSIKVTGSEPFTVTDEFGYYSFEDLPPGKYIVREVLQPGWVQTNERSLSEDSESPGLLYNVIVAPDRRARVDFGNWQGPPPTGDIYGFKWHDLNGDGVKDPDEPLLEGWLFYIDANNNGVLDEGEVTVASSDVPKAITDFSETLSNVTLTGLSTTSSVEVTLDVTHSFVGDLSAWLISPSGTQVKLFGRVGGQFNNFENITFADDAERSITTITSADRPYTGRWRPDGLLSDFIGENPTGEWTLRIFDHVRGDEGWLNSWSLTVAGGELTTTTGPDGTFVFPELPSGKYVVREEQQPGWEQTYAPPLQTDQSDVVYNVMITPGGTADAIFGNRAVTPELPGDYNRDGSVDAADYVLWRKTLGQPAVPSHSGADGSGSGVIEPDDYDVWRENFGNTQAGAAATSASAFEPQAVEPSNSSVAQSLGSRAEGPGPELPSGARPLTLDPRLLPAERSALGAAIRSIARHHAAGEVASDAAIVAWLSSRDEERTTNDEAAIGSQLSAISQTLADSRQPTADSRDDLDGVFELIGTAPRGWGRAI